MSARPRRILSLLLRLAVSGALLAYLFTSFDAAGTVETFRGARLAPLLPAALFFLVLAALTAWRWRIVSEMGGPLRIYFDLTFIGYFFNNLLPTNFGGDVVRVVGLSRRAGGGWRPALVSVFWDRFIGLAGLLLLGGAAWPARWELLAESNARFLYPLAFGGFALAGLFIALAVRPGNPLGRLVRRHSPLLLTAPPANRLWAALAISLAAQAAGVACVWALGLSLGVPFPLVDAFLYLPLANLAAMLPVSLSGLGVREGAMVYLLGLSGVPAPQALALSLAWFFFVAAMSLWGGFLFLRGDRALPPSES